MTSSTPRDEAREALVTLIETRLTAFRHACEAEEVGVGEVYSEAVSIADVALSAVRGEAGGEALLRECRDAIDAIAGKGGEHRWDLALRIDAFLTASGLPAAPPSEREGGAR